MNIGSPDLIIEKILNQYWAVLATMIGTLVRLTFAGTPMDEIERNHLLVRWEGYPRSD